MRAVFVDANGALAETAERLRRADDMSLDINLQPDVKPADLPDVMGDAAIALMWAAAKGLAHMDGGMRAGQWHRTGGLQLTGKTLGLIGFGGIAAEVARLA